MNMVETPSGRSSSSSSKDDRFKENGHKSSSSSSSRHSSSYSEEKRSRSKSPRGNERGYDSGRKRGRSPSPHHHHHHYHRSSSSSSHHKSSDRDEHRRSNGESDAKKMKVSSSSTISEEKKKDQTIEENRKPMITKMEEEREEGELVLETPSSSNSTSVSIMQDNEEDVETIREKARLRRQAILNKYKQQDKETSQANGAHEEVISPNSSSNEAHQVSTNQKTNQDSGSSDEDLRQEKVQISDDDNKVSLMKKSSSSFDMFSSSPVSSSLFSENFEEDSHTFDSLKDIPKSPTSVVLPQATEIQVDAENYGIIRIGEIMGNRYKVFGKGGTGMFSKVLKAWDLENNNKEVAIKVLRKNDMMKRVGVKEAEYLKEISDTDPEGRFCCIKLLNHFVDREFLCLVFELMESNLTELVKKFGKGAGLPVKVVCSYTKQLLFALYHLKRHELIHADVKPDNILVNNARNRVFLGDFGSMISAKEIQVTPHLVSGYYRAPEVILGIPTYSHDLDTWSIACCIFEMATGKLLFKGVSNNDMLRLHMELKGTISRKLLKRAAFRTEYFDDNYNFLMQKTNQATGHIYIQSVAAVPPTRDLKSELLQGTAPEDKKKLVELHDLLSQMLSLDPSKRLKVEQALKHPFIADK